jgi:hypothetical protein
MNGNENLILTFSEILSYLLNLKYNLFYFEILHNIEYNIGYIWIF